jgi:putative zinc finger/helix-turn-helix YgiT family protein
MNRSETCYECAGTAHLVREIRDIPVGGRKVSVEVEIMRCHDCGEGYFLPGAMRAAQQAAADVVRRQEELLTAGEIRDFRQQAGLTQTELEQILGSGPKTVTRWERGAVAQSRMADTLIRILRDHPPALHAIAVARGVVMPKEKYRVLTDAGVRQHHVAPIHEPGNRCQSTDLRSLLDDLRVDSEAEGSPAPRFAPAISWSQRLEAAR